MLARFILVLLQSYIFVGGFENLSSQEQNTLSMPLHNPVSTRVFRPSSPGNASNPICHDDLVCNELLYWKVSQVEHSSNLPFEGQICTTEPAATNLFQGATESMWNFLDDIDILYPSWESVSTSC